MPTPRIEQTLDAMVAVAGRLFGFLGNTIIRHRAEQTLTLLWNEGYVPVKRAELESWRTAARTAASPADCAIISASIEHLTREWQRFHDRQPATRGRAK